jgi:hypothetical protein
VFGPKKDDVIEGRRNYVMKNFIHNVCSSPVIVWEIKAGEMGVACDSLGK